MTRTSLVGLLPLLLAGCPASPDGHHLWLAPDGSEIKVHLINEEPDPF